MPINKPIILAPTLQLKLTLCCCLLSFYCCTSGGSSLNNNSTKFQQYYLQGEQLYQKNCSNCHQINGIGLGLLYPPINKSDFVDKQFDAVICLIKNGKKGELIVNGLNFNKAMPAIPTLTNLEIAEITTYIYNTWEHKRGIVDVKEVDKVLFNCKQ